MPSGGSITARVTIEVDAIGPSPVRGSILQVDRPNARERGLVQFDAINEHKKKLESGNAEPYPRRKQRNRTGGQKGRHL